MSNNVKDKWEKYTEGKLEMWENAELGTIAKTEKGYVVMYPKVVKIGPFASLERAKMMLEDYRPGIDNALEEVAQNLVNDSINWK